MIRRTALLSALTCSLLLGACSKNQPANDAQSPESTDTQSQVDPEPNDAPEPPPPRLAFWPIVGPLVAGNYGGQCMRMPDARQMDASIGVAPDGKVVSGDLAIDFGQARKAMLMRVRDDKGQYGSTALFEMESDKDGLVNVQSSGDGKGTVTLTRDGVGIMCGDVAGDYKLAAQPLHTLLPRLAPKGKQTLACLDTKNLLVRRDTDVVIDGHVVRIGDEAIDMNSAITEMMMIDDSGESIAFSLGLPEDHMLTLLYDGAGKLKSLSGRNAQEAMYSCEPKT